MEDKQILALLHARSEEGLSALESRFGQRLKSIAMNILGDPQDAQECLNDTYLALWNAIPPESPAPLSAYAFRVVRNIALTRLRRRTAQKRGGEYILSLEELGECVGHDNLTASLESKALGDAINTFLGTLSREDRVIFLRRHWFGDSVSQIARDRKMTENAVSIRLSRTRSRLKRYLIKEGSICE